MSDECELSREAIARQFMLPERGAKIASLLRQERTQGPPDLTGDRPYCICRQTRTDVFMIGCDKCEEWFHGDCIKVTERDAKYIKVFYCRRCRIKDPTLEIRYREKKRKKHDDRQRREQELKQKQKRRCGECMACYRNSDCGRCDNCKDMKKFGGQNKLKQKCKQRQCLNFSRSWHAPARKHRYDSTSDDDGKSVLRETNYSDDDLYIPKPKKPRTPKSTPSKQRRSSTGKNHQHREKVRRIERQEVPDHIEDLTPRQCFGPGCNLQARVGSKYCSDECGLNLATNRIYQILPQRIQEWSCKTCVAEENNKKQLEIIRKQQLETQQILKSLEKRHQEIDANIAKGKSQPIDPHWEDAEEEPEGESQIYCFTCGHEVHSRNAVRHMEKCFNKHESQTSFGSSFKTRLEGGNMFCDYYNSSSRTYCKRLKVLCPEHTKDPKVSDHEVCGCPLVNNIFDETEEFCRIPKKKCLKHYCWDKLRRAEIDMERVRQWLKIDELLEQERQIRMSMSNRAGVLPLLLHSTYDHQFMEQMAHEQARHQDGHHAR